MATASPATGEAEVAVKGMGNPDDGEKNVREKRNREPSKEVEVSTDIMS